MPVPHPLFNWDVLHQDSVRLRTYAVVDDPNTILDKVHVVVSSNFVRIRQILVGVVRIRGLRLVMEPDEWNVCCR